MGTCHRTSDGQEHKIITGESNGKEYLKLDAQARLDKVENATQIEADTLVRSARARLGQVGRATPSEAETIVRRSARARKTQQQASTTE